MIIFYINVILDKEEINRGRLYLIIPNFDYLKFENDSILVDDKLLLKIKILL